MNDLEQRALELLEQEDREAAHRREQEARAEQQSRLANARRRIKEGDREITAEQARRDAEQEAQRLGRRLQTSENRVQERAEALRGDLEIVGVLRAQIADARRRAGRPLTPEEQSTKNLVETWWRDVFGAPNGRNLTGTP